MEIKDEYKELIYKLLKYDNYDDIRTIVDMGIMSRELMLDYKTRKGDEKINITEKIILEQKINELEKINSLLKEKTEERIKNMREKLLKEKEEEREKYEEKIIEKNKKYETINNELLSIKNEYIDKLIKVNEESRITLERKVREIKEEKNKEIEYFKEMIERNNEMKKEELKREMERIEREKDEEIIKLKDENKRYRDKYEKLELNSVLKGKPYENAIEIELSEYFERNNNIYTIKNCSNQVGKGDYIVINNYTGIRIMIEAKNMPTVSSTIKDQQPKFYNNIKDRTNNYDGGIIISSGRIDGKKNYQIEIFDDNKVVSFIENYNLNNVEKIYLIIEVLHQKIQDIKMTKVISEKQMLETQVELYKSTLENYKKLKITYESQSELLIKQKNSILNIFGINVDDYILENTSNTKVLKEGIITQIESYINKEREKDKGINKEKMKNKVVERFNDYIELYKTDKKNGITTKKITNIINNMYSNMEIKIET